MQECHFEINEIHESFAHELAKLIRELGFNDSQVRQMFNATVLHKHPVDYTFFSLLLMNKMGKGDTPEPVTRESLQTMEIIRTIWWKCSPEASQWLLEKTLLLLYTTYR